MSDSQNQPVEQIFRWQPKDENNRPIGGTQVIKYTTQEELVQKLQEQNELLIRKLRSETRKVRLGILDNEEISDDAQRISGPIEFKPRELSDDERYELSRRLLDPTTAVAATEQLLEATIGAPVTQLGKVITDVQVDNQRLRAQLEANAFVAENPNYYKCPENFEAITSWMLRYNLAPVKANFQKAYDTLSSQDVLIQAPLPEVTPVVQAQPVVQPVEPVETELVQPVREELPQPQPRGVPTGLTRDSASDFGPVVDPGSDIVYELINGGAKMKLTGLAAINAMPSEEYKRRLLTDSEFGKKVDKLYGKK